jgi:hypothetical protein
VSSRGRWERWNKKDTVDDYLRLSAHQLATSLDPGRRAFHHWGWTRTYGDGQKHRSWLTLEVLPGEGVELHYNYRKEPVEPYRVRWVTTSPHYGGRRYWWLCPRCWRRVAHLYGGHPFLCRECHDLTYTTSQSGELLETIDNRLRRIKSRLGGGPVGKAPTEKPRGMHWRTYGRLCREYWNLRYLRDMAWQMGAIRLLAEPGQRGAPGLPPFKALEAGFQELWEDYQRYPDSQPVLPKQLAREWLERQRAQREQERAAKYGTLGEIARAAGVPYEFAREAQAYDLLRPDGGRGKRRKRYRKRLANWLEKLYLLNQSGYSWEALQDWTRRRFRPGHEHEARYPAGFREVPHES